jgi:hypothetical protein
MTKCNDPSKAAANEAITSHTTAHLPFSKITFKVVPVDLAKGCSCLSDVSQSPISLLLSKIFLPVVASSTIIMLLGSFDIRSAVR